MQTRSENPRSESKPQKKLAKLQPPFDGSELPPELLHNILVRLPPDDLLRCLCVSKAWNAFIRQRSFIKSHLQRSIETNSTRFMILMTRSYDNSGESNGRFCTLPFEDDDDTFATSDPVKIEEPLELKGPAAAYSSSLSTSIHGLICLVNHHRKLFALWNPSIQKFKKIPFPTIDIDQTQLLPVCYGFGYDSVNDDYQIVQIRAAANSLVINIYSLKRNSWKRIENMPHCWHDGFRLRKDEALFSGSGALCWLMGKKLDGTRRKYMILTFDLATEKYVEFRTPVDVYQFSWPTLMVLGGYLCIRVYKYAGLGRREHDFWIMKEYGVIESWTRLCSMVESHLRTPLVFSKNGERVLLLDSISRFFWYDLGKKIAQQVENPGLKDCYNPTVCDRSLCLLDGDPVIVRN